MKECLVILMLLIVTPSFSQITHQNNVFLADHQNYLFFTHRHLRFISTYMSICQAKPAELVKHHPSMNTIAAFDFNNTNMGINILGQDNTATTVFHYAKINPNGICTIYQVDKQQIALLYQYNFGGQFAKVILLDKYHAFLWNCETFVRMEYSLYSKQITFMRNNFLSESGRNCEKYRQNMIICWGSSEIILISIDNYQFDLLVYDLENITQVAIILVLDQKQSIFFACSFMICNIIRLNQDLTVQILEVVPFVDKILGADFNRQTNRIVILHPAAAVIFVYLSRQKVLRIEQSIDFYSDIQCVFIENVRFLDQQILVNCNNFMGEAQHLVLIRDRQLNRFFSYRPFQNADPANPCLFDGNIRYIFAVCKKNIVTRMNNFQFFQIGQAASNNTITIQCFDTSNEQVQLGQNFQLTVIQVEYNEVYINQQIIVDSIMNYDSIITIKPRNKFVASAIDSYLIESTNCQFIKPVEYQNVQTIYYISLFNREKCIQIVAADSRNFYRVLQINSTTFYIQLCFEVKMTYGCELQQIKDGVFSLRLFVFNNLLYKIYMVKGCLYLEFDQQAFIIFQDVVMYQIKNQFIRVFSQNIYYSKSIANIVNNCGDWVQQQLNKSLSNQKQNIAIPQYISQRMKTKKINQYIFPFIFWKGYYAFLIDQLHITKLYVKEEIIIIYELPYNIQQYEIQSISNVDQYIVIQYTLGFFQIYDLQRESVDALIAVEQEYVLCDIIMMDRDVIIVPIRQQNYVLRIKTDPVLTLGPFPLTFSLFREKCSFQISPQISNGSCPTNLQPSSNNVSQTFNITIRFNIQQISVQNQINIINQPSQCNNCQFQISLQSFMGPIFAFEFNDDDFGAFKLTPYFDVQDCDKNTGVKLQNMAQIRSSDQNTQKQLLVMNRTHLLLLSEDLSQKYNAQISEGVLCASYIAIQSYYLVLCQHQFLIFNKTSPLSILVHNLQINSSSQYELKAEYVKSNRYDIYILDEPLMHIFALFLEEVKIEYSSDQQLSTHIYDFDIINNYIFTLQNKQICTSKSKVWKYYCYNLTSFIPHHYATDYQYQVLATYYSNQNTMRALLISKTNDNLHIDLQIHYQNRELVFKILNVYAGYVGFTLKGIISINRSQNGYTNFILYYEDLSQQIQSSIVVYYIYNSRYKVDKYIGQIRSAIFLQNYFAPPYNFSFLSFAHRLYISHLNKIEGESADLSLGKIKKECILVRVEDKIRTVSNYETPPLLKFLILKAKNINDLLPYYIKINYEFENNLAIHSLIGLGSVTLIFVLLVVATNQCKDNQSEMTIHFMSQQIEKQYSQDNSSDLLLSKSSPRSNGSPLSERPSHEDDD